MSKIKFARDRIREAHSKEGNYGLMKVLLFTLSIRKQYLPVGMKFRLSGRYMGEEYEVRIAK